jgi:hypothetical protein
MARKRKNTKDDGQVLSWVVQEILRRRIKLWTQGLKLCWSGDVDPGLESAILRVERHLYRRTRKPLGWPECEPLPTWWPGPWLSVDIYRAVLSECGHCGSRVTLAIYDLDKDLAQWRCAYCMRWLTPTHIDGPLPLLEGSADEVSILRTESERKAN